MNRILVVTVSLLMVCGSLARAAEKPELMPIAPRLRMSGELLLPQREQLYQRGPDIAWGGGVFLVVWQDGYDGVGGSSDILGLRIDRDGVPLDKEPLRICCDEAVQNSPAVAFCNGRFLVVWADLRNGEDYDLYATLVDAAGKVKTPNGFLFSGGPGGQAAPVVSSDEKGEFLVLWKDHRSGKKFDIYGARVAADSGEILDRTPRLLLDGGQIPAVTFNGGSYFVSQASRGCLVSRDLEKIVDLPRLWSGADGSSGVAVSAWGKSFGIFSVSGHVSPWGWNGNGSIIGVSVSPDGQSPEYDAAKHGWYDAARTRADREMKNAIDAARWRNHNGWPMGMPGGFKGSHDGTWPSGGVAAAYNGRSMVVVWCRARFVEKHQVGQRDLFLKRVLNNWAYVDEPKLEIAADKTDEIAPVLEADAEGNAILAYEKQQAAGGIAVVYRVLREDEDRDPPRVVCVARTSPTEMVVIFDEPVDAETASVAANYTIEGSRVVSAEFYTPNPGLMREVVLRTDAQEAGKSYVLRVKGVRDLSSAHNAAEGAPFEYVCQPGVGQRSDFIERWAIVGAFPNNPDVEYVDVRGGYPSPGDTVKGRGVEELIALLKPVIAVEGDDWAKGNWNERCEKEFGGDKQWRASGTQAACLLRLSEVYGAKPAAAAYAHTYVYSDREREVIVRVDSNEGNRAWLNGELLHDDLGVGRGRGIHDYTNETPGKLKRGWNRLLIRVGNRVGYWLLVAQIVDRAKQPIRDLTYQLESPVP